MGVPANFGLFAKIFRPFRETCIRRVQQKNLRKTVFNTFGVRAKSFLTVDGKLLAVLSKLLSTSLEENFAWLFFYMLTYLNHSGFWRKVFGRFQSCVSNFQRNILQVAFSMSRRLIWTKISLCKKQRILSSSLSDFGQKKTLELRVNFSAELSKTHSTPSVESLGKNHLLKKIIHFSFSRKVFLRRHNWLWKINFITTVGVLAERIGLFAKNFRPFCENCFRLVQRKSLKKNNFSSGSYFGRSLFDLRRKSFGSVVKTALYVSRAKFCGMVSLHSSF